LLRKKRSELIQSRVKHGGPPLRFRFCSFNLDFYHQALRPSALAAISSDWA
jgi:hypothetical protein